MNFVRLSLIPALLILQSACQLIGALPRSSQTSKTPAEQKTPITRPNSGPEYNAYVKEVRIQFANNNYEWLEGEAKRLRVSKERLPGGYWKLHVLYFCSRSTAT